MQDLDLLGIFHEYVLTYISLIVSFISLAYAHSSRKLVVKMRNSIDQISSMGKVMSAIYKAQKCLLEIQESVKNNSREKWDKHMAEKNNYAGIIIAESGSCPPYIQDVLEFGKMLNNIDEDLDLDFDTTKHSKFFLDSVKLIKEIEKACETMAQVAEGGS